MRPPYAEKDGSAERRVYLVFYLVTHGVSLPADGELQVGELAAGLYYSGLGWLRGLLP